MVWKRIITILLALSLLLSVTSCNGGKETPADNSKSPGETDKGPEVSLTPESKKIVWWWNGDPEDVYVNEFIIENPDFEVDNTYATCGPFGEDLTIDLNNLAGSIVSDEQPDLFLGWMTAIEAYYTDMFMPIQQYIDVDPELKIEDFDSQVFELTTFNDLIYFIPYDYSSQIMVWNKGRFEDAGLDPDSPPKNWDEFLDYCQKLTVTDTTGAYTNIGFFEDHFQWDTWNIISNGEHFVDKTGINMTIDTPNYLELMELARKINDIHGGKDKLGTGGLGWWFLFNNVSIATWSGSGLGWLCQNVNFDFGVGRTPVKDESKEYHSAAVIGAFMGIPRTAKNPKGGWKLMKYVTTDGRVPAELASHSINPTNYMTSYVIHKPTREKIYAAFEGLLDEELMNRMKQRDQLIEECDMAYYQSAYQSEFNVYFTENFKKMLNNQIAPKDFLSQVQNYADALRDDFVKQKEAEDWIFDEDGNAIPPSLQDNK